MIEDEDCDILDVIEALNPLGYYYMVSITGINGPGNYIVVYATLGDFYVACVSAKAKVLWNHSCGGSE